MYYNFQHIIDSSTFEFFKLVFILKVITNCFTGNVGEINRFSFPFTSFNLNLETARNESNRHYFKQYILQ